MLKKGNSSTSHIMSLAPLRANPGYDLAPCLPWAGCWLRTFSIEGIGGVLEMEKCFIIHYI